MDLRPGGEATRKRVLVADDDADLCALLVRVIEPLASVLTVHDGEAALEAVGTERFDAIVSDYMLPGISGLELIRLLRAKPPTKATPILLISGHDRGTLVERAREAGADAFLGKPFTLQQLRQAIAGLLGPTATVA